MPYHKGPHGVALGLVWRQRERRKLGKKLFCGFHGKEQRRQGEQVWDSGSLDNFSSLCGKWAISSCPVHGPGMISPECESILKEIVGV